MTLSQTMIDKINAEAEKYGFVVPYNRSNKFYNEDKVKGYQVGATEWAGNCKELMDALVKLNTAIDKTWNECNTQSIPDKYKKEISAAQAQCDTALAKYKEVENGKA